MLNIPDITDSSIKPHRLKDQSETIPSKRNPLHIFIGWHCFSLGCQAKAEQMQTFWWKLGEAFGDYLCMDRLNDQDIDIINAAAIGNARPLTPAFIGKVLTRAENAAALHYTAGLGLLAETYHRLGKYFHKRLCAARDTTEVIEDSLVTYMTCHSKRSKYARVINYSDLPKDPPEYQYHRTIRNIFYELALKHLTMAIELEDCCQDITHNAIGDVNDKTLVRPTWWHSGQNNLTGMQDFFIKLLRCSNLSARIQPAIKDGREEASDIKSALIPNQNSLRL